MCESFATFSLRIDTHCSFDQVEVANYYDEIIRKKQNKISLAPVKSKSSTLAYT